MFFRELETERLWLRNISSSDADFILEQFSSDFINRYLFDYDPMASLDEAIDLINFYSLPEPRTQHRWIMVLKESSVKIGTLGYHMWDRDQKKAEIGYDLKEECNGRGYMNEAMKAVLAFGKEEMALSIIEARIYVDNLSSIKVVEKNGFMMTGTRLDTFHEKEYLHNIYQLGICRQSLQLNLKPVAPKT